ncbi:MAG: MOMP family protein [Chlamydiales bacterium]|nr:MOMP family protein [Chlamydiales bacterium]
MGADVFITADFILWTPREEGLEYVMTGTGAPTGQGSLREPDFGLEPGFKVGLGLNLGHDGWDVFAEYTWLTSSVNDSVNSDNATWLWNTAAGTTRFSADWDFNFNAIDLELGRNFFVSQYLTLRPHYGFKGTWQDQDYKTTAEIRAAGALVARDRVAQDFDYWGFGIRTGMDTAWHFCKSWSIYGNFAISALWSGFDIDRKDTTYTVLTDTSVTTLNTENNFHTILPVLELAIGLRWEIWVSDDDYHFGIDAGWEEQVWWGMNRLIVAGQPQRDNGDLTMQGLTLKFRFDF